MLLNKNTKRLNKKKSIKKIHIGSHGSMHKLNHYKSNHQSSIKDSSRAEYAVKQAHKILNKKRLTKDT